MPVTPVNGSTNFPATPNSFLAAVETIAQQNVRSVISTNKIEDAFYEYEVKDGKVIEEAIIEMAEAQAFVPTVEGAQPDLSPLDPKLHIKYFIIYIFYIQRKDLQTSALNVNFTYTKRA